MEKWEPEELVGVQYLHLTYVDTQKILQIKRMRNRVVNIPFKVTKITRVSPH